MSLKIVHFNENLCQFQWPEQTIMKWNYEIAIQLPAIYYLRFSSAVLSEGLAGDWCSKSEESYTHRAEYIFPWANGGGRWGEGDRFRGSKKIPACIPGVQARVVGRFSACSSARLAPLIAAASLMTSSRQRRGWGIRGYPCTECCAKSEMLRLIF